MFHEILKKIIILKKLQKNPQIQWFYFKDSLKYNFWYLTNIMKSFNWSELFIFLSKIAFKDFV